MLPKSSYNRARVMFNSIIEKEKHAKFLFDNQELFPSMALDILKMIDTDEGPITLTRCGLFAGYIDILAHRRRNHDLYPDYKRHMDNHIMFLYLKERVRRQFRAIIILKIFVKRCLPRFIEWFYRPDAGPFMKNKTKTWLTSV